MSGRELERSRVRVASHAGDDPRQGTARRTHRGAPGAIDAPETPLVGLLPHASTAPRTERAGKANGMRIKRMKAKGCGVIWDAREGHPRPHVTRDNVIYREQNCQAPPRARSRAHRPPAVSSCLMNTTTL